MTVMVAPMPVVAMPPPPMRTEIGGLRIFVRDLRATRETGLVCEHGRGKRDAGSGSKNESKLFHFLSLLGRCELQA
jgi:hypothetical protein